MIVKKDATKPKEEMSRLWDGIEFKCDKCGSTIQLEYEDRCTIIQKKITDSDSDKFDVALGTPRCPVFGCREVMILKFKGKKLVWTSSEGWKPK